MKLEKREKIKKKISKKFKWQNNIEMQKEGIYYKK